MWQKGKKTGGLHKFGLKILEFFFATEFFFLLCTYAMQAVACVWRSENNLWSNFSPSAMQVPGVKLGSSSSVAGTLTLWALLTALKYFFFLVFVFWDIVSCSLYGFELAIKPELALNSCFSSFCCPAPGLWCSPLCPAWGNPWNSVKNHLVITLNNPGFI